MAAAVAGTYSPKGFSQADFDVALLAWRLGGRRLLHALGEHSGFPCVSTVARNMGNLRFAFSPKGFSAQDMDANAKSMLVVGDKCPKVMCMDEIAAEPNARYHAG